MKHGSLTARPLEVTVAPWAVGPLGLTLSEDPDLGGGTEPTGAVAPVIIVNLVDDRETCKNVHDFVFFERQPTDVDHCPAFVRGPGHYCRRAGRGSPCAFLEAPDAPIWAKAHDWKRTTYRDEAGRARVAYLYDPDDLHPEGAPLPDDGEGAQ